MGLPSSSRNGARVIWICLHTAEGARRASDLYNFFNANQNASSHVGIDSTGFYDWVDRSRSAWTLLNGNPRSVNAELCGFAKWTREQWLSTGTVDGVVNPRAMVRNAALWAKREAEFYGIPKKYIGTAGVAAGQSGIIIHWDYSRGTGDGDHWDLGANFPWDVFFNDMNGVDDDMDYAEGKKAAWDALSGALTAAVASASAGTPDDIARAVAALSWNGVAGLLKAAGQSVADGAPDDVAVALRTVLGSGGAEPIDYDKLAKALLRNM